MIRLKLQNFNKENPMTNKKSLMGSVQESMNKPKSTTSNRFALADDILDNKPQAEVPAKIEPPVNQKKTMVLFEKDVERITNTIERFMEFRQVISQSNVIRLGLLVLGGLTNEELKDLFEQLKK